MKGITNIGIVRDHSASMTSLRHAATQDYNECISAIKDSVLRENQEAALTVVKCGVGAGGLIHLEMANKEISSVQPMSEYAYDTTGHCTPLFDSVGELITRFKGCYANDTFLIMVITDGQNNRIRQWNAQKLALEIQKLQGTDRWTFTFRVPRGYKRDLVRLGIPDGNILEWEQSTKGMETATKITTQAVSSYFTGLSRGVTGTGTFYADLSKVTPTQMKATLDDISDKVKLFRVGPKDPVVIRHFMEAKTGSYKAGNVFYQLTKTEPKVQDYKGIVIRDKKKGNYYTGYNARDLLELPRTGTVRIVPVKHDKFDIFIQSTSYNRKLVEGTTVLVLEK